MLTRSANAKLLATICSAAPTNERSWRAASSGWLRTERRNWRMRCGSLGHLPRDIGLHEHAQAVRRADILQASGRGTQAQIDRDLGLGRHRQLPGETRMGQHTDRIAEPGDHGGGAGGDHHDACGGHGGGHDQPGNAGAQRCPERRDGLPAVMVAMTVIVVVVMAVMVVDHGRHGRRHGRGHRGRHRAERGRGLWVKIMAGRMLQAWRRSRRAWGAWCRAVLFGVDIAEGAG